MFDSSKILLIGVDGGGTGCRAAVGTASDGILGTANGGRANAASDTELALKNIANTVNAALFNAGISDALLPHATIHCGLAGILTEEDSNRFAQALGYKNVVVTDDRPTTVSGALGGRDGYVLSVGTGTITASSSDGKLNAIGGWGFQVSDQASGAWLGRAALEKVLLCHDGLAEHTELTREILGKFGNSPEAISSFSILAKPGDYATLAPTIIDGASSGDRWGQSVMRSGANHLLKSLRALGFKNGQPLCLTGGVGPHYASYLLPDVIAGQIECQGSALDGAFHLAGLASKPLVETAS